MPYFTSAQEYIMGLKVGGQIGLIAEIVVS